MEVLCNILTEFGIPMILVRLKNEYEKNLQQGPCGKHLSDIFPIKNDLKQGDAFMLLRFNFALENAIRRVQDGWKLSGTYHLMDYSDVNILRGSVHTIKNTQTLQ
jgi:hypothetical protein